LAQFEEDFNRVIDCVTQEGKWPLVVFIDDLDRCAPMKSVEVVEAINILGIVLTLRCWKRQISNHDLRPFTDRASPSTGFFLNLTFLSSTLP
jgi:hypothetical protein